MTGWAAASALNKRLIFCFAGAAASVTAALLLPGLMPRNAGFSRLCLLLMTQEVLLIGLPACFMMMYSPAAVQGLKALWGRPNAYQGGLAMLAAVSFTMVSILITVLFLGLLEALGISPPALETLVPETAQQLLAAALCATLIPAAAEELMFRGLFQGRLAARFSQRTGLWGSAVLFALLHRSLPAFPQMLAIGLVLGVLRIRSSGLVLPIIFHAFYNFSVLVLNFSRVVPSFGMIVLCSLVFAVSFRLLLREENSVEG